MKYLNIIHIKYRLYKVGITQKGIISKASYSIIANYFPIKSIIEYQKQKYEIIIVLFFMI